MIQVKLFKCEISGTGCDNAGCKKLPQYFDQILNTFFIKQGTTCLWIGWTNASEIYCRDCIDQLYYQLKPIIDSKLWIFK